MEYLSIADTPCFTERMMRLDISEETVAAWLLLLSLFFYLGTWVSSKLGLILKESHQEQMEKSLWMPENMSIIQSNSKRSWMKYRLVTASLSDAKRKFKAAVSTVLAVNKLNHLSSAFKDLSWSSHERLSDNDTASQTIRHRTPNRVGNESNR